MSSDLTAEAAEVANSEQALDLIRSVLGEHLDVHATIRAINEVLAALPPSVVEVKVAITKLMASHTDHATQVEAVRSALVDMGSTFADGLKRVEGKVDTLTGLLTEARDEAAAGHRVQKMRLSEEREARKTEAEEDQIAATKAAASAAEVGARWKERGAIATVVTGGVLTAAKMVLDFIRDAAP